jgi:hypothetical protein
METNARWKAGVILVYKNHWYFEISFGDGTAVIDDEYGMAHHLAVAPPPSSLGILHQEFSEVSMVTPHSLWDWISDTDILRVDMEGQVLQICYSS